METSPQRIRILILSMLAMIVCFTIWVSLAPIAKQFQELYHSDGFGVQASFWILALLMFAMAIVF
jgi:nitrate/nitrite transporter NarK